MSYVCEFNINDLKGIVPLIIQGNTDIVLSKFRPIDEADETSVVWINHNKNGCDILH